MSKESIRILYTADWHLRDTIPSCRMDDFKEAQFKKLAEVAELIDAEKVHLWLNGGDLFDTYNPSYELVNRFTEFLKSVKVKMYTVAGNHDMMAYNETLLYKTALGNLAVNGMVGLIAKGYNAYESNMHIAGINARKQFKFSDYDNEIPHGTNIIVSHDPITTEPAMFDHMLVSDVAKSTKADLVLCAHVHEPFDVTVGKTRFINPGPIFRQTVNEMELEPRLCIIEVEAR